MGTIEIRKRARGTAFIAQVCINRKRKTKVFNTKKEANVWIIEQEDVGILIKKTTHDAFEKYEPYVMALRGWQPAISRLKSLKTHVPNMTLEDFTLAEYNEWKDIRSKQVGANAFNREAGMLSKIFRLCVDQWGWLHKHPIPNIGRLKDKPPRMRGIATIEIESILINLDKNKHGVEISTMFLLAIETACRLGELIDLTWEHVFEKYVFLPITKNGDSRKVPLSLKARELIATRKGIDPVKVFQISQQNASKTFARHSVNGVHFHDARSEAITRMSKKLPLLDLARAIGHRDLKSLQYYYKENIDEMADFLN